MQIKNFNDIDKALLIKATAEGFIAKQEANMNTKIENLKEDFNQKTLEQRKNLDFINKEIEFFAMSHKPEFAEKRSMIFPHGTIGFRNNPPKVAQLNRKYSIATTIELIKRIFKGKKYLRLKEEINKEEILLDYSQKEVTDEKLASIGLKVDQGETFFAEINWETIPDINSK